MDDLDDVDEIIKKMRELGADAFVEETDSGELVIRTGIVRDEDTGELCVFDDEDYDDEDEDEEEEEL